MNDRAKLNMLAGAGIFGVALAFTIVSFVGASHSGRGTFVVAYGAMIVGAIQLIVGFVQAGTLEVEPIDRVVPGIEEKELVIAATLAYFFQNPHAPNATEISIVTQFVPSASPEKIREIAVSIQREHDGLNGYLARKNDHIGPEVAGRIIRGVNAVMRANSTGDQTDVLNFLGRLLYLTEVEVARLLRK